MSAISVLVAARVSEIVGTTWDQRNGNVVPTSDSVKLKDGAVVVNATYLYADLANSSTAAHVLRREVTGKIIRSYLDASVRIIRHFGGEIRSFDGDRVMGIFIGDAKNTNAFKAGLGINWAVEKALRPTFTSTWPTLGEHWKLSHGVGIDTGEAMIVRGGVRDHNDLISIGEAPNVAAKLSALRTGFHVYATDRVYNGTDASVRVSPDGTNMWTRTPAQTIGGKAHPVVASRWTWTP